MMGFCHKIGKAFTFRSAARQFRKSGSRCGSGGGQSVPVSGDGDCDGAFGLLKLKEDVQMCGYRDVEVMYSILRRRQAAAEAEAAAGRDSCAGRAKKRTNKDSIWKFPFWNTDYCKSKH